MESKGTERSGTSVGGSNAVADVGWVSSGSDADVDPIFFFKVKQIGAPKRDLGW